MPHCYSTRSGWLLDRFGRHTLLRGVNLGGSTKLPSAPGAATHHGVDLGPATVSFVGRPFPPEEADRHLARIASWGFNVLRFLVSWEAIEHAGAGCYDEAYLDYVREMVIAAGRHGLLVFVDPHQDVWSRFSGGDGAPRWTFDVAGLLPERFAAAGAVELHALDWVANYQRVPAAFLWTLFFGGETFVPGLAGAQALLQDRYIAAVARLAERLADLDHVLGYDTLNEPSPGYIGRGAGDLATGSRIMGEGPPPFSSLDHLAAADGVTLVYPDGRVLNPEGLSIWRDGCPLRRAGVWDLGDGGRPVLLRPDYFTHVEGRPVHAWTDFMVPFIRRFREGVRAAHPGCLLFIEGPPQEFNTPWHDPDPLVVHARHWYDFVALTRRRFDPRSYSPFEGWELQGLPAIAEFFATQLRAVRDFTREQMGDLPVLIGEFGIPYEMNGGEAYCTGDYWAQLAALDANYQALEAALLSSTQWNYTADNSHALGDGWNHEDLSIFSADDQRDPSDLDQGGRGTDAFCRPYVRHAAGRPEEMRFDRERRLFTLGLLADPTVEAPTEVFVPRRHYPVGPAVEVSRGEWSYDPARQVLTWWHPGPAGLIWLRLFDPSLPPAPPALP